MRSPELHGYRIREETIVQSSRVSFMREADFMNIQPRRLILELLISMRADIVGILGEFYGGKLTIGLTISGETCEIAGDAWNN